MLTQWWTQENDKNFIPHERISFFKKRKKFKIIKQNKTKNSDMMFDPLFGKPMNGMNQNKSFQAKKEMMFGHIHTHTHNLYESKFTITHIVLFQFGFCFIFLKKSNHQSWQKDQNQNNSIRNVHRFWFFFFVLFEFVPFGKQNVSKIH